MQEVLSSDDGVDMRLQKKALFLVGDLAEQRIETLGQLDAFKLDEGLLKSVAMQTESDDMDTQEKVCILTVTTCTAYLSITEISK